MSSNKLRGSVNSKLLSIAKTLELCINSSKTLTELQKNVRAVINSCHRLSNQTKKVKP